MASDVEKLVVLIEAQTKAYERAMTKLAGKTDEAIKKSKKSLDSLDARMTKLGVGLVRFLGAAGFATSIYQLPRIIGDIVQEVDRLGDTAEKIGLTAEALQELRFAGEQTGVATNVLDMGMQRFSRRVAEAASGTGVLLPVLQANNIALRDADGTMRPLNDLLDDYADLIKNAGSEQEQLLLAFKAFDSEGAAMVNTLRGGSAALAEQRAEAQATGQVIDNELVAKTGKLADDWNRFMGSMTTAFQTFVLTVVTQTNDVIRAISTLGGLIPEEPLDPRFLGTPPDIATLRQRLGLPAAPAIGPPTDVPSGSPTIIPDTKASAAVSALARQYDALTASLENQIANLGLSSREQEINTTLHRLGADATAEQEAKVRALAGALYDQRTAMAEANMQAEFFAGTMFDALSGIVTGAHSARDALGQMVARLAEAALQAALLGSGPLAALFGTTTGTGGVGGILGSLASALIPGLQHGGPALRGHPYLVGERGPELFVPSMSGRVTPNGGGGVAVVELRLSDDLDARIDERSSGIAVQVTQGGISRYHRAQQRSQLTGAGAAGVVRG